jgi:cathepsin F
VKREEAAARSSRLHLSTFVEAKREMFRVSLLLIGVLAGAAAAERFGLEMQFETWMKKHGKKVCVSPPPSRFLPVPLSLTPPFVFFLLFSTQYESETEKMWRMKVFAENMDEIDRKNYEAWPKTQFGINKFADLRKDEFKQTFMGMGKQAKQDPSWPVAPLYKEDALKAVPTAFDWRQKGVVTPVKNQGQCGSCWSFSTTGNVEAQWKMAGHELVGLSEQNLVDCDHHCMIYEGQKSCDAGCNGGLMPNAFSYIIENDGIDTEASYPYTAMDGTCHFSNKTIGARISNFTMISHDEAQMAAYSFQHGPMSIAADAAEWQFYIGGVFYLPCGKSLDHGILIVGWGVETDILDEKMPYWIVKNSWGADWGESGYLKLERGTGECGLNEFPCSSIINK